MIVALTSNFSVGNARHQGTILVHIHDALQKGGNGVNIGLLHRTGFA